MELQPLEQCSRGSRRPRRTGGALGAAAEAAVAATAAAAAAAVAEADKLLSRHTQLKFATLERMESQFPTASARADAERSSLPSA